MPALINNSVKDVPNFLTYGTITVDATTNSASEQFTSTQSIAARSIMVYNAGPDTAFVSSGIGSATAAVATTSELPNAKPVAAGAIFVIYKGPGADTVAAITSTGTATVYFTAGDGA